MKSSPRKTYRCVLNPERLFPKEYRIDYDSIKLKFGQYLRTGRFLNVDSGISGVGGEILGYNMFAYCFNNPINMGDSTGLWPKWLDGALNIVSGVTQMLAGAVLGTFASWTGVGAVVASFLLINGSATITQGIGQIVNAVTESNIMREDNIARTGVKTVGKAVGGTTGEKVAENVYDAAVIAANVYAGVKMNTPSACFIAGTAVLTATGYSVIEDIRVGDKVWSENPETGEKELKDVVQTFVNETDELVHVHTNGEEIITTPEHPFYVPKKGWIGAINLRAGDILVLQSGEYVIVELIQHEILESPVSVYNFEVEDFHTYYVSDSAVLVHNACGQLTEEQQIIIKWAKEYEKIGGISRDDAIALVDLAKEYGLNYHYPQIHSGRSGIWGQIEHIKIFKSHIPIIE